MFIFFSKTICDLISQSDEQKFFLEFIFAIDLYQKKIAEIIFAISSYQTKFAEVNFANF